MLLEKVWGGRWLEHLGRRLPRGALIGESWEVADLGRTSASGAGGGAMRSVIASGALAGRTLEDAIRLWGDDLLPRRALTPEGAFPLLIKVLDARENLSVQVHPSPAYAAAHAGAHLKTECWYILHAEPGSVIYKGVKPGVSAKSFRAHIADGSVVDDLVAVPAVAGEMHSLPSGTVHTLGAGVAVAEIQTPSDTTFRVFDWGRQGRELHVEEALACIDFSAPPPAPVRMGSGPGRTSLAQTKFFSVDGVRLGSGGEEAVGRGGQCAVVMVVEGACTLRAGPGEGIDLRAGTTVIVPAALVPEAALAAASPATALIAQPS